MSRKRWVGVAVTVGVLFALSATAMLLPMPAVVRDVYVTVQDSGPFGALLFAAFMIVSMVIPPLPTRPLIISAGVLFDPFWGVLLTLAAQGSAASINFFLARAFGKHWLRNRPEFRDYIKEVELLGKWQSIVLLRLFAGFTFDWFSYLAGLLRVRFRTYLLATLAGTAPRTAADVYAGNFLVSQPWLTALIGGGVTVAGLLLLARHSKLRGLMHSWGKRPSTD